MRALQETQRVSGDSYKGNRFEADSRYVENGAEVLKKGKE